jgi:ADP-ribosylglycohydrolase
MACLEGLSVGDAFGEIFSHGSPQSTHARKLPPPTWPFTDDTQMALSVASILQKHGGIEQDALAASFAEHYEGWRGYGAAMYGLLSRIERGEHWLEASRSLFSGQGSFGNGAAMRVAPVGAYFAEDLDAAARHAALSAEVTHAHPEGISGAIAVAMATALAWRLRNTRPLPAPSEFLRRVLENVPLSQVSRRLLKACDLANDASLESAIADLGNGSEVSAQDTVPFALWCAARHLNSYEEALWFTASALGDCDTNCAIVGGIVVMCAGLESIPQEWLQSREQLPPLPFAD